MKITLTILVIGLFDPVIGLACPPPPDHRSADGGWELLGSPLGTPIAVASTVSNTSLAAYYVTLESTYSNVYYGVVVEEVRHGVAMGKELLDCYWYSPSNPKPWIDLAIDPNGNPSVVYQNEAGDMWYAHRNSSTESWDKELVLSNATNEVWLGLAFDPTGRATVAYLNSTASNLMYLRRDIPDDWNNQLIATDVDLRPDVALMRIPSGGFEMIGIATHTNQLKVYTLSSSIWVEETVSLGTNNISSVAAPREISGLTRSFYYVDGFSGIHALHQPSPMALWEDRGVIATIGVSGFGGARIVDESLVAAYYEGGVNAVVFTPATSNLTSWMVATNSCPFGCTISWHYRGFDAVVLDEGCGDVGVFYRIIDGNKAVGNNHSEIQWTFAGPSSGPPLDTPHVVDWDWAYHDDDDGIDERQTEQVPGTDFTFIPSQPILENQGFRIYFLAHNNFAGGNSGNAWIRWWNGESETWLPTFQLSTVNIGPFNFHGLVPECYELVSIWAADIWSTATRPGTNYYAIQLTSPNISPADWDYLLRTRSYTDGAGSNNLNQAMSEEADFADHDWPIYIGPDADGDGMDDDWETVHFGSLTNGIPGEDSDLDGNNNLAEFHLGTSPKDPDSNLTVWWDEASVRLGWSTVENRRYRVQTSPGLLDGSWQDLSGFSTSETNESPVGTESVLVSVTSNPSFFRIRLSP